MTPEEKAMEHLDSLNFMEYLNPTYSNTIKKAIKIAIEETKKKERERISRWLWACSDEIGFAKRFDKKFLSKERRR